MNNINYKAAYERQKKAREIAEKILEDKSRELYEANQSLTLAYNRLKDQKSQLLHQEKLASIGQLAAGVAHEINNPTGFVKSNLNTLESYIDSMYRAIKTLETIIKKNPETSNETKEQLTEIRKHFDLDFISEEISGVITESLEGINRIEMIVKSLKNFARPDKEESELYSINECIENTLRLVNSEVKYKAKVELELGTTPPIRGMPGAMSQVILNLIINASDAIDELGEIIVKTYTEEKEIVLSVTDDGRGMPQDTVMRIFDPFFTTKEVGKGTGLGLAISHGIVKKHGGRISVKSKEGEGTEFSIFIPIPTEPHA